MNNSIKQKINHLQDEINIAESMLKLNVKNIDMLDIVKNSLPDLTENHGKSDLNNLLFKKMIQPNQHNQNGLQQIMRTISSIIRVIK